MNKFKKDDFVKFETQLASGQISHKAGKISEIMTQSVHNGKKTNTYYVINGTAVIEESIIEKLPNLDDCYYLDDDYNCLAIRKGKVHISSAVGFTVAQNEKPQALLEMPKKSGLMIRPQIIRKMSDDFFEVLKEYKEIEDRISAKLAEEQRDLNEKRKKSIIALMNITNF